MLTYMFMHMFTYLITYIFKHMFAQIFTHMFTNMLTNSEKNFQRAMLAPMRRSPCLNLTKLETHRLTHMITFSFLPLEGTIISSNFPICKILAKYADDEMVIILIH